MTNEMDVLNMDERQRMAWLRANRAALIIVGIVWIGMITWEFAQRRIPYFMLGMIPVIALVRFAFYRIYVRLR